MRQPIIRIEPHPDAVLALTKERGESGVVSRPRGQIPVCPNIAERAWGNGFAEVALGYISDQLAKGAGSQRASIAIKEESPWIHPRD